MNHAQWRAMPESTLPGVDEFQNAMSSGALMSREGKWLIDDQRNVCICMAFVIQGTPSFCPRITRSI
ncbi:MAG: hypothetical protein O7G85_11570 [Planctomycetota bacterium]|nr:hypothetical protein [Planctomycetota bacterium]